MNFVDIRFYMSVYTGRNKPQLYCLFGTVNLAIDCGQPSVTCTTLRKTEIQPFLENACIHVQLQTLNPIVHTIKTMQKKTYAKYTSIIYIYINKHIYIYIYVHTL